MNLNTDCFERLSVESAQADETRCACCQRDLKSASELIRGKSYVICESCYRNFLNKGRNSCEREFF